jgi:hypothetical protein
MEPDARQTGTRPSKNGSVVCLADVALVAHFLDVLFPAANANGEIRVGAHGIIMNTAHSTIPARIIEFFMASAS